jgi:hypothetical protein
VSLSLSVIFFKLLDYHSKACSLSLALEDYTRNKELHGR